MTVIEFAEACYNYGIKYGASVTSWGRTNERAVMVGGFQGDPHTWWRGADFVYNHGPNRLGAENHRRAPQSCPDCSEFGLKIIHEKSHDHAQPKDFPPGKVTKYPIVV